MSTVVFYARRICNIGDVAIILSRHSVTNANQEAVWILSHVMGQNPSHVSYFSNIHLSDSQLASLNQVLKARCSGVPLALIFGEWNFFGYDFFVNQNVLIPRMDSEVLVETFLDYAGQFEDFVIVDLCCGTGCLGLASAIELKKKNIMFAKVLFVDISDHAIKLVKKNCKKFLNEDDFFILKTDITSTDFVKTFAATLKSQGLEAKKVFILSNPPYIKTSEIQNLNLTDPLIALDGGGSGLVFYEKIIEDASFVMLKNIYNLGGVFLEIGFDQSEDVVAIAKKNALNNFSIQQDMEMRNRVVKLLP